MSCKPTSLGLSKVNKLNFYLENEYGVDFMKVHIKNPYIHPIVIISISRSVTTLALGSRPRQRVCKGVSQEEARESRQRHCKGASQEDPGESHHILPRVLESVREYEGVNPHTPKATPTLGDGVPVDFQKFRERLQGSNLNVFWRSWYHWKALGA